MTTPITPRQLVRRIRSAFRQGNLDDRDRLKDALAWVSYMNSGEYCKFLAEVIHRIEPKSLGKLPGNPAHIAGTEHCRGKASPSADQILYWVEVPDWDMDLPHQLDASWQGNPIRTQLIAKATDWCQRKQRKILWLSDLAEAPLAGLAAKALMADLGRLNAQANKRRRVVVFSIKVKNGNQCIYMPTMADSGFTFYWRAWTGATNHGMTRSLRDNRAAYREWVVPKADVEIVDAWPLGVADFSLAESDLDDSFWQACRAEIEGKRAL